MPAKFRNADANTLTTDVGVMIPTTVMEKIIEKMETYGMILPLITRTSYKGGVKIPTSTVKPVATWVAEGAGSDKQKKTTDYISFGYHKLRCAVSVSLETDTMALAIFETTLINNVVEAMTKKLEGTVLSTAPGTTSPAGIFAETPPAGQALKIAEGTALSYKTLVDMEAALPQAYEGEAVWLMTKKTFMSFVGMVDDNK
jgi:HK97 family phage major capsid protein